MIHGRLKKNKGMVCRPRIPSNVKKAFAPGWFVDPDGTLESVSQGGSFEYFIRGSVFTMVSNMVKHRAWEQGSTTARQSKRQVAEYIALHLGCHWSLLLARKGIDEQKM